jgi:hypothetical protein
VIGRLGLVPLAAALVLSACAAPADGPNPFARGAEPLCSATNETMILVAQSVQSATRLPCITGYPAGWSFQGKDVRRGSSTYWLSSSAAGVGSKAVEVQLLPSCEPQGEPFTDPRAIGADAYVATSAMGETRSFVFEGGCVVERILLPPGTDPLLLQQARATLGFASREALAATLLQDQGVTLCGAGAEPCAGASSS